MPAITIDVRGFAAANARVNGLRGWKAGLHAKIGEALKRQHVDRIERDKVSPSGIPWASLKASTIAIKTAKGNPDPYDILIDTRALVGSFQITEEGDIIRLRNPSRYAVWLQDGTPHMVARPFMGLSNPNVTEIKRLVTRHVRSHMRLDQ